MKSLSASALLACLALAACGPTDSVAPPVARKTPAPASVVLSPSTLTFTGSGASNALTSTASESSYGGTFSASSATCTNIATISPTSGTTFTVTPVAAGSCTFAIADGSGQTAMLSVSITTTTVGGQ